MLDLTKCKPEVLFPNLLADIYNTYDDVYWTEVYLNEFSTILETGNAKDMLAWLLAIDSSDVMEYVEKAGDNTTHEKGLPAFITRFKPSYTRYQKLVESITETAPVAALLEPEPELEVQELTDDTHSI